MLNLIGLALAALAALQAGGGADSQPHWVAKPTDAQLIKAYPDKALYASKSGHVLMQCAVKTDGTMADCKITEETPTGYGFGAAILKLAPLYRLAPAAADGTRASDGTVNIPVDFRV
jgi:TonB family protein